LFQDTNGGFAVPALAAVVPPPTNPGWNNTIFSASRWISAGPNCGAFGSQCNQGPYIYQICWTQKGSGTVSLQFLADNDAVVCLNDGASCPADGPNLTLVSPVIGFDNRTDPSSNFQNPALNTPAITNAATGATSPLGGTNSLQINVGNLGSSATGLEVQGLLCGNVTLVTCPCPTCSLSKP